MKKKILWIVSYKVADTEDYYVSLPTYGIRAKSNFGWSKHYDDEMKEWWNATNEIETWLHTFDRPMDVSSKVEVIDGKTIITYSGTATLKDGEETVIDREVVLDFAVSN